MSTERSIASVLLGETRHRVLGWLLLHPHEKFYLRELIRHTGAAHGAVQRELETLTRIGLIRRSERGNQVFFEANTESPIFSELAALLTKTGALVDILRIALEPVAGNVEAAFVYGSAARGGLQSGSDIDILVVGDASFPEVVSALAPAQERLGREINPAVYPPAEFARRVAEKQHFLTALRKQERLFLLGGDDALGRLAPQWLAGSTRTQPGRNPRSPARS